MLEAFRKTAYLEGASFLLLLLVAMPLKYLWDLPLAVRIVWTAHGALFVLYTLLALIVWKREKWSLKIAFLAFAAAFVPFGPFLFDHKVLGHSVDN